MPAIAFPAMTFAAAVVLPPMTTLGPTTLTPYVLFGSFAVAVALRPMIFPVICVPVAPADTKMP